MQIKAITALQRTLLFGCLTEKDLAEVARRAIELRLHKGEVLFISGEPAKGIFVVVNGKIRVFQQNAEGREQVMHVDTAGAVIGEVAVFDDGPYPASAISNSTQHCCSSTRTICTASVLRIPCLLSGRCGSWQSG